MEELDEEPEIDYYDGICKGMAGYQVSISGGDLRYDLGLIVDGETINLTRTSAFHDLGSNVIEWRTGKDNKTPKALIFRIIAHDGWNGDHGFDNHYLYVAKLDGKSTCTVRVLKNATNEAARKIADN